MENKYLNLKDHIQGHLEDPLDTKVLAHFCQMSYSHFRRWFRKQAGITPAQYVRQCKMESAKAWMTHDQLSPRETSEKLGFRDYSSFSRACKAYFGVAPILLYSLGQELSARHCFDELKVVQLSPDQFVPTNWPETMERWDALAIYQISGVTGSLKHSKPSLNLLTST